MAHVSNFKKEVVGQLVKHLLEYPIVGVLNMENLPAPALQTMKAKLRDKAVMAMTKKRLMLKAFEEAEKQKPGISKIITHLRGMPALLFTKENPFAISKIIRKSKSPAAAKAGQVALKDILVKAGPTPFLPGPIIGELGSLGIKSAVENGKVTIKEDKVVVKEGETVNATAANLLSRLDIKPMEVGLDLSAVMEDGIIYDRKILDVDEDQFISNITEASQNSRNLAFEIAYPTKETIVDLLIISHRKAKSLGIEAQILNPGIINEILAKAHNQSISIKQLAR